MARRRGIFIGGPLGDDAAGRPDLGIPDPSPRSGPALDSMRTSRPGADQVLATNEAPAPVMAAGGDTSVRSEPDLASRRDEVREWVLEAYHEAKQARETGPNPRKLQYQQNYDAYWGRIPSAGKQAWQADQRLPTVADHVERFVAAIREALGASADWYNFFDPLGKNERLEAIAKSITDAGLAHCSQNVTGQHIGFIPVFANGIKAGCMANPAWSVTWSDGRLRIESVDSRELLFDPSGQGLYRLRVRNVDLHRIQRLKALYADGEPLYDHAAIDRLVGGIGADAEETLEKERAAGHGKETGGRRRPVRLIEFLGTILARDGSILAENQLVVLANETEVIRGPSRNPFWHGMDWIVSSPLIDVPFSVEGRTYVESFAQLTDLYIEFTNLLLDGIRLEVIPAYQLWPEALDQPQALADGITPGKLLQASEDWSPDQDFVKKIDMGALPPQAFTVWEAISQLVREASAQNELRLGRLADKSNITATEIETASAGGNVLVKHIAEGIEQNLLSPIVELAWYTILQHLDDSSDEELLGEIGPDTVRMVIAQREDLRRQSFRLRATGISGTLALAQEARRLLATLEVISRSDLLTQQFLVDFSLARTLEALLRAMRVDASRLRKTNEERAAATGQSLPVGGGVPGAPPPDANPTLPVNVQRGAALRVPRGTPPGGAPGGRLPQPPRDGGGGNGAAAR
jgi:hypothetical protein